jgi:FkbM family methyltransferase
VSLKSRVPYWDYLSWAKDRFGARRALLSAWPLLWGSRLVRVPTPDASVWLRADSTDRQIYDQVFLEHDQALTLDTPPRYILDAGAHIGLVSCLFARQFPEAIIIAVEAAVDNYALLVKNTARYPNVRPWHGAVWKCETTLTLENPHHQQWGYRVSAGPQGAVPALSVPGLLRRFQVPAFDLVKLDIEGAEIEALETASAWLPQVTTLHVEIHERFRPGCQAAVLQAASQAGFTHQQRTPSSVIWSRR